ncbi:MAG: choice-of-anchor J domain-containing protein [Chitinophagaceae bacterium]|nr:choice-of-anchor J domain-containing protein [Chitinophagaceae bacterium]
MKNKFIPFTALTSLLLIAGTIIINSCKKEQIKINEPEVTEPQPLSFTEDFNHVGGLTAKGWAFKNNSYPVGSNGWRQGRYEAVSTPNYKFPDGFIGFPAYNATNSPNDFISCDVSCVNFTGDISAWLITPPMTIKNGDVLEFYTRAPDDTNYPVYTRDRMQVLANITDGSANVGTTPVSVGNFTTLLLDINPGYVDNANGGYPFEEWTAYSITVSGLDNPVTNARIAFRYMGKNAGVDGPNYASIVGIDNLVFSSN